MKIIKGNKQFDYPYSEFLELREKFNIVEIDLGTGDGKYIFKNAQKDKNTLHIGIDPSAKQLEIYSKKALRNKLENTLFVVAAVENMPEELNETADSLNIILPWGTLLQSIIIPTPGGVSSLAKILKVNGKLTIILGYSENSEPRETKRLELPELTDKYIIENILPLFSKNEFEYLKHQELTKGDLKKIGTTWGNRLTFGKDRKVFQIMFKKL